MRGTSAAALAALLVTGTVSSAVASLPLAPGKPAGVHAAQMEDTSPLLVLGLAAVAIGVTLAATNNNGDGRSGNSTSTVSTTSSTR
jgi:hypothetical protein